MTGPTYGEPVLSSNPVLNVIKKLGSSPLFLAAAILYSVSVMLGIITNISGAVLPSYVYDILANAGMDYDTIRYIINSSSGTSAVSSGLSAVPSILLCVAMWMIYATCRDRQTGNISTAGLTICKVITTIMLVALCIAAAGVVIIAIAGFAGGFDYIIRYGARSYYGYGDGIMALVMFLCIIVLAIVVLLIAFYASLVRAINRMKNCALTGMPDHRISKFLTVMLWISGVIGCLNSLSSLFLSPLVGLEVLAAAVCSILFAVLLGRLRQQMTILAFPPVQPVYPAAPPVQPVYQPVQPQQPVYPQQAPASTPEPVPTPESTPAPVSEPTEDTPEE
ncbi:MAG: hypothetical protein J1E06_03580 [Acutalibacter sp.]|nr:hypothetical protein [Acutalibacter sp.]